MGDSEREAAILARCEAAPLTCGKCRLPIHSGDTVRHFGFYVAHLETRCIELLHGQLAEITASYEAATAQLTAARARAERAEGALVEVYPLLHEACQGSMCCLNGCLADKVRAIIGTDAADRALAARGE